jgi:hypothetical protein
MVPPKSYFNMKTCLESRTILLFKSQYLLRYICCSLKTLRFVSQNEREFANLISTTSCTMDSYTRDNGDETWFKLFVSFSKTKNINLASLIRKVLFQVVLYDSKSISIITFCLHIYICRHWKILHNKEVF